MLQQISIHLLVPLQFNRMDFFKIGAPSLPTSKKQIHEILQQETFHKESWFQYCFRHNPLKKTFQLTGSPLLNSPQGELLKRFDLNQPVRSMIELHSNEKYEYVFSKESIPFRIGKIQLLFFSTGMAFLNFSLSAHDLDQKKGLDLNFLSNSIQKKSSFRFITNISKEEKIIKETSFHSIIQKILSLQSFIPLSPYQEETYGKAYSQILVIGETPDDQQGFLFESLRNIRKGSMRPANAVSPEKHYQPFDYISWIIGERSLSVYADLQKGLEDNRNFLLDSGAFIYSVAENYTSIYAYLLSMHLWLKEFEHKEIPSGSEKLVYDQCSMQLFKLSSESHINELFDHYLVQKEWNLPERIAALKEKALQKQQDLTFTSSLEKKCLEQIFSASQTLQSNITLFGKATENQRNTQIRDLLRASFSNHFLINSSVYQFEVDDQTLLGYSASGKSAGELDLLIKLNGLPYAVMEALNIQTENQGTKWKVEYLHEHIRRIGQYDQNGLERNIVFIYLNADNFSVFYQGLLSKIENHPSCTIKGEVITDIQDISNQYGNFANLRVIKGTYQYNHFDRSLYIFVIQFDVDTKSKI